MNRYLPLILAMVTALALVIAVGACFVLGEEE